MTAFDKLRQLVNKATPGPWMTIDARIGNRAWVQVGPTRNKSVTADVANLTDARLIALVPQLAELVAEMGEALEKLGLQCREYEWLEGALVRAEFPLNMLLARLDALFEKETA